MLRASVSEAMLNVLSWMGISLTVVLEFGIPGARQGRKPMAGPGRRQGKITSAGQRQRPRPTWERQVSSLLLYPHFICSGPGLTYPVHFWYGVVCIEIELRDPALLLCCAGNTILCMHCQVSACSGQGAMCVPHVFVYMAEAYYGEAGLPATRRGALVFLRKFHTPLQGRCW